MKKYQDWYTLNLYNYYGNVEIFKKDDKHYILLSDHSSDMRKEISEELFLMLKKELLADEQDQRAELIKWGKL